MKLKIKYLAFKNKRFTSLKKGINITIVATIFAILIPTATAINGYFQNVIKEKELSHKKDYDWIDMATKGNKSLKDRLWILEAMKIVYRGEPLEKWAETYQTELFGNMKHTGRKISNSKNTSSKDLL